MDDSTLERELEGLLAASPSADFRARVRQRIAQEPPLSDAGGLRAWLWVAAGGVAACAVAAVLFLSSDRSRPDSAARLDARAVALSMAPTLAPRLAAARRAPVRSSPRSLRRRLAGGVEKPAPVMIVDAAEVAAWRQLLNGVHEGVLDLSAIARAAPPPASEDFVLPPIVIEAVVPIAPEEGVRQ